MSPITAANTEVVAPGCTSPRARRRRLAQRGVSLVEISAVVTISGILATLATYSVRERMFEAHSVEAVAMLGNVRTGLLAKADDLTGNSGNTLQIGGRVGGFGGPLGLPGVLGELGDLDFGALAPGNGNGNGNGNGSSDSGSSSNGNGNGNGNSGNNGGGNQDGGIDGDGNRGHGNNDDHCDPDNPGNSGGDCGGNGDSGSGNSGNSGSGNSGNSGNGSGNGNSNGGGSNSGSSGSSNVDGDHPLCTSATPIPSSFDSVKGHLYQSRAGEWQSGSDSGGWQCLNISMSGAQRFQYGYDVGASSVPGAAATPAGADASFAAWARGDLDGDGRTSWFVLNGASFDGRVTMAPAVTIIDQGE